MSNVVILLRVLVSLTLMGYSTQHREHKIHNIVLYPDKHSWCKTTPIVQVISHPGCGSVSVENNVCVGGCFSYIVPETIPKDPGDVPAYCDACKPENVKWRKITLQCTEGENKVVTKQKHIQIITHCACMPCREQTEHSAVVFEEVEGTGQNQTKNESVDDSIFSNTDILSLQSSKDSSPNANSTESGLTNDVISSVLTNLTNEDQVVVVDTEVKGLHKNVWKSLLEKVEALNRTTMDSNTLNQLIKSAEDELKVKFNYKRMKQALMKFKKYKDVTKAVMKSEEPTIPRSPVALKESTGGFVTGLYSKSPTSVPSTGTAHENIPPMLDAAPKYLKPATSGSEINYHSNTEANSSPKTINVESQTILTTENLDAASKYLKPATSGSEISYHSNIEANSSPKTINIESQTTLTTENLKKTS